MTVFEGLQAFISANSTLAAKIPGGIVPQVLPQNSVLPVMVMKQISSVSTSGSHDSGIANWVNVRWEFTVWGGDFKTQEQSIILLLNMFKDGYRGYLGGGTDVYFSPENYRGPRSVQDPSTRIVGMQLDILGLLNTDTIS